MEGGCFSKWALDKATPLWRKHTGWGEGRDKDITRLCSSNGKTTTAKAALARTVPAGAGAAGTDPEFRPRSPHSPGRADLQSGVSAKGSEGSPPSAYFPACHRSLLERGGVGSAVTCQGLCKCSLHILVPVPLPGGENKPP